MKSINALNHIDKMKDKTGMITSTDTEKTFEKIQDHFW